MDELGGESADETRVLGSVPGGDGGQAADGSSRKRWWIIALVGLLALLLGGGGALLLTGGGSDSTSGASGGTPKPVASSTTTTHVSAVPTAAPAPAAGFSHVVWVAATASGPVVRVGDLSGAAFHTVATLPMTATVLAAGGSGRLMYSAGGHLHGLDLATGADTDYGGGAGFTFFGGAFSPDGSQFAYVRTTDVTEASLRVLTLASGSVTALRSFPSTTYDAPRVWLAAAMTSIDVVGYTDAGAVGAARLDPTTGARTAHTDLGGHGSVVLSADGSHGAYTVHSSLGDEGDVPGALFPQPFNTLRTFTVGAVPTNAVSAAHHAIAPLAYNRDGSRLLFFDDSAAGGFAGIGTSPDFGLLEWNGTTKSQIAPYGTKWDAAAFVDATTFVAAKHDPVSGGVVGTLMRWNGSALTAIDTLGSGALAVYAY